MRLEIYDTAGPTPSIGRITQPTLETVSSTRLVEVATFRNGPFEGDAWRREFFGDFDFSKGRADADTMRVLVDGERHAQFDFDRPLDLTMFESSFAKALDSGVEFIGNRHANHFVGYRGRDDLMGGGGDDRLRGYDGDDALRGGGGDDRLKGEGHNDALLGGGGSDRLFGSWGHDHLTGGGGDDLLKGDENNDVLRGGGGEDLLVGGSQDDRLIGGPGDDRLIVGHGEDELTGGGGADVFVFTSAIGTEYRDRVTDFRPGRDLIDLSAVDAQLDLPRNQSFHFIGEQRFSGASGELRFDGQRLIGNVGDAAGDRVVIKIDGVETFREEDFLL